MGEELILVLLDFCRLILILPSFLNRAVCGNFYLLFIYYVVSYMWRAPVVNADSTLHVALKSGILISTFWVLCCSSAFCFSACCCRFRQPSPAEIRSSTKRPMNGAWQASICIVRPYPSAFNFCSRSGNCRASTFCLTIPQHGSRLHGGILTRFKA